MEITRPVNHIEIDSSWQERNHIVSHKVSDEHLRQYRSELSMYVSVIELPNAVVNCNDVLCTNDELKEQIEVYCVQLIDMCLKAGSKCFPHIQTKQHKSIPSWKDNVQLLQETVLQKNWKYKMNGSSKEGTLAEEMREVSHRYHCAIRDVTRNENNI